MSNIKYRVVQGMEQVASDWLVAPACLGAMGVWDE